MPKASIVVPAFNAAKTLPQTLDTLRSQSLRDLEIVVVDDGSTDDTAKIAERQSAQDSRVRLVSQINRGLAGARNSGIAAARGEFVGFCDADDCWLPEKLATHVTHLEARLDVGLSYSGSRCMDEQGRPMRHAQRPRLAFVTAAHVFKRNPIGNGSAPVIRRAALEDLAYRPSVETARDWVFDESFRQSEDIECWMRLVLGTDWSIEGVPGLLTEYRIVQSGLSAQTSAQLASWERMVAKLRPMAPQFFDRHEAAARAYQLRYLARRAISNGQGALACDFVKRAYACSTAPLIEEPVRSVSTWLAAQATARFGTAPLRLARSLRSAARP